MKEVLEKSFYASLGAWLYLHEKADEIIKDLIAKGKMAPEEGKTFLNEVSKRVEDEKEIIKEKFSNSMDYVFEETGLATKKDLNELKDDLKKLDKRLNRIEKSKSKSKKRSQPKKKK